MSEAYYELVLNNNQNIKFTVDASGTIFIDNLSLKDPEFKNSKRARKELLSKVKLKKNLKGKYNTLCCIGAGYYYSLEKKTSGQQPGDIIDKLKLLLSFYRSLGVSNT